MNRHCPLQDISACQHPEHHGLCQACRFDFDTLDPDEDMFRLRRANAERVFEQYAKDERTHQADAVAVAAVAMLAIEPAPVSPMPSYSAQSRQLSNPFKAKVQKPFQHELRRASGKRFCLGPEMMPIAPGTYLRGSPPSEYGRSSNEGPQLEVRITPFAMGLTPITVRQWQDYLDENKKGYLETVAVDISKELGEIKGWFHAEQDYPVTGISWHDAQAYIAWLNARTSAERGEYRLPSEAEWEYAARAGTTTPFYCGETINTDQANFNGSDNHYPGTNSGQFRGGTTHVKTFQPNNFGLYDMHGNVWEWCEDAWHGDHANAPKDGSAWTSHDRYLEGIKVLRGGSWRDFASAIRCAGMRCSNPAGDRFDMFGFRLAYTAA